MASKAKKFASAKKTGKATKASKAAKAVSAKKTAVKARKAKPAAARSKPAKKTSVSKKAVAKKVSAKPAVKSVASKQKLKKPVKTKKVASKASANKKALPVKLARPKATNKKLPASARNKPTNVGKSAKPKPTTIKNYNMTSEKTAIKKTKPAGYAEKKSAKTAASSLSYINDNVLAYDEDTSTEDYMNKKHQDYFRALLLQRKREFMEEMERTVHHLQDEAINFSDPNDRATQEEAFSLELRTRDRELKYIKNIEDALQRIDEGEYGYCDACGVEIGVRRLEARPTATLCIDCKTLDEIREKQMGG